MISGCTLTTFPNAILTATTATKSKGKSNNKQQQTSPVHIQRGIGTAHKLVEKIQTTGFYPAIKGKGKLRRRRKEEFHNL